MDKKAVVVIGMHRSGTSAITRMLNLLGCEGANQIMEADQFNERGYWESPDITKLNEDVLSVVGSSWNSWERFNTNFYLSPRYQEFEKRALDVLSCNFSCSNLIVVKDPRLSRTLPLWSNALRSFGAQPTVVVMVRDPSEVALSLLRRNGTNPSVAQLIWLRYVLDAEENSRELQRAFVSYDELLSDWRVVASNIGSALGVAWPRLSLSVSLEIERHLEPSLRHHDVDDARLTSSPKFSPWIKQIYGTLQRWTQGKGQSGDLASIDRIRIAFSEATDTFARPLIEHHEHGTFLLGSLNSAGNNLKRAETKINVMDGELVSRDEEITSLRNLLCEAETRIESYQTELLSQEAEISMLIGSKEQVVKEAAKLTQCLESNRTSLKLRDDRLRVLISETGDWPTVGFTSAGFPAAEKIATLRSELRQLLMQSEETERQPENAEKRCEA